MTDAWDELWTSFVVAVERLNERLDPDARGFVSRLERSANDVFALRALVSYSPARAPGDERLVISLDVQREGAHVVGRADLARGDGVVLDETTILPAVALQALATSSSRLENARTAVTDFVARQQPLIESELRGPR
jgi:hypothetical protein